MTYATGITANRAFCLYHLRVNPKNVNWTVGTLENALGEMCDVGLACQAFNIPRTGEYYDPEVELALKLDMPQSHVRNIYSLNDTSYLKFDQVADVLEAYFNQEGDTLVVSPYQMYKRLQNENKINF
jgi:hypothetical protein